MGGYVMKTALDALYGHLLRFLHFLLLGLIKEISRFIAERDICLFPFLLYLLSGIFIQSPVHFRLLK